MAEVVGFTPAEGGDATHLRGRDAAFGFQAGGDIAVPVERADGIARNVGSTAVSGERGVRWALLRRAPANARPPQTITGPVISPLRQGKSAGIRQNLACG